MDKHILISLPVEDLQTIIIDCVNSCLKYSRINKESHPKPRDHFLSVHEASEFLNLAVPTLYSKVSKGEIPYIMQCSKRLYFSEQELLTYIKAVRRKTKEEIAVEADELLTKKKGGESSIDYNKTPNDNYSEDTHSCTQMKNEQAPRKKTHRFISLIADGMTILKTAIEIFG